MKPRTVIFLAGAVVFAIAVVLAMLREVNREEAQLAQGISGVAEVTEELLKSGLADIARTDRLALMLVDPRSGATVALKTVSPFVPPMAITIGQKDALDGQTLQGAYYLVGITDKDGDLGKPTRGEVFGRSPDPIAIGQERTQFVLDRPFRGQMPAPAPAPSR